MADPVDQPGLGPLREAAGKLAARAERAPRKRSGLASDAQAGLTVAVTVVPDGMAEALLIGVNPIYGLYGNIMGPILGGVLVSTPRLIVSSTSMAALVAAQSLGDLTGTARSSALFLLIILSGGFQILFGLLGLARVTRFVSYSVMTGFLAGIAVLLVLSQAPTVSGVEAEGANQLGKAWSVLSNLTHASPSSLITAGVTLGLAVLLGYTRVGRFGTLAAIAASALIVAAFGWKDVALVQDIGRIPRGFPSPVMPKWGDIPTLIPAAVSLAVVVLIQGAGVGESVPMPRGRRRSQSRDFIAQGVANVAAGLFQGVPVGGSLSATALGLVAGSRSRWTSVFMGISVVMIVVAVPGLVSRVAMPALGALLIIAGLRSIKPSEVTAAWRAGWPARIVMLTSFMATIVLPIQTAVGLSIVLSLLIHLARSSVDVRVVQLVELPGGRIQERKAPKELRGGAVTVLDVYGTLFFAGARTLERRLPRPGKDVSPVVILRLRGHVELGATLADVLADYDEELREVDGRLYITGLSPEAYRHLKGTGKLELLEATPILGESTRRALTDASSWLIKKSA